MTVSTLAIGPAQKIVILGPERRSRDEPQPATAVVLVVSLERVLATARFASGDDCGSPFHPLQSLQQPAPLGLVRIGAAPMEPDAARGLAHPHGQLLNL